MEKLVVKYSPAKAREKFQPVAIGYFFLILPGVLYRAWINQDLGADRFTWPCIFGVIGLFFVVQQISPLFGTKEYELTIDDAGLNLMCEGILKKSIIWTDIKRVYFTSGAQRAGVPCIYIVANSTSYKFDSLYGHFSAVKEAIVSQVPDDKIAWNATPPTVAAIALAFINSIYIFIIAWYHLFGPISAAIWVALNVVCGWMLYNLVHPKYQRGMPWKKDFDPLTSDERHILKSMKPKTENWINLGSAVLGFIGIFSVCKAGMDGKDHPFNTYLIAFASVCCLVGSVGQIMTWRWERVRSKKNFNTFYFYRPVRSLMLGIFFLFMAFLFGIANRIGPK